MQIPTKILKSWLKFYQYGTLDKIAKSTGLNKFTISRAINSGKCTPPTYYALYAHFLKEAEQEKKMLEKAESDFN